MKGSKWLIVIVILIVIGVVIAKHARTSSPASAPEVVAQAPAEGEPAPPAVGVEAPDKAAPAIPTQVAQEPVSKSESSSPPVKPAEGRQRPSEQPKTPTQVKALDKPGPNPGPEPPTERPAEQKPKPEGPLPGSKLKECLNNGLPTMADFGMGTCRPCKAMEPILKQATQDYWGRANIVFVELDKYPDLAREYRIRVMPTQIFFDSSGKPVDGHMGYMDRQEIDRRLAALGVK